MPAAKGSARTPLGPILPLIVSDFKAETNVTVKNGEISGEDSRKIDMFLGNVEKMNLLKFLNITVEEAFQKEFIVKECKGSVMDVKKAIKDWFLGYLKVFDCKIAQSVDAAIRARHLKKCAKKTSLYNFTQHEVPRKALEQIEHGIKNVPTFKKDYSQSCL